MKQKERVTLNQFDTALMEQIGHVRSMNVNVIELSMSVMFSLMLRKRIFGDVKPAPTQAAAITRVMEDAKVARATFEMQQQQQDAAKKQERRIIVPGQN